MLCYLLLALSLGIWVLSGRLCAAAEPSLRDFRWETQPGGQLVFRVQFNHAPAVRPKDEHIEKRYYYLDFLHEDGPAERADWKMTGDQAGLITQVTRLYYPQQKVLRFVFYVPFKSDVRFQMSTRSDNSCVVTVMPIAPHDLPAPTPVYTPAPGHAPAPALGGPRKKLVVIDPGHGGHPDNPNVQLGARTSRPINGSHYDEKDIVLDIAKYLEAYIRQSPNLTPYMTRETDKYVSLDQRIALAKQARGDLFVSIHLNGTDSRHKTARGFEIYYVSDRGTNKQLTRLENDESSDVKDQALSGGGSLGELLRSLASDLFRQRQEESRNLCMVIDQEFVNKGPFRLYDRGVKADTFRVLLNDSMPAVLTECGFLDNPDEARELILPSVQKRIAALLFNGVNRYFAMVDPEFEPHGVPVTN